MLNDLESLPPEWSGISLQIRQRARELKIAFCDEDTDLAIFKKIDIAIGNTDLEKLEKTLKVKGKAMKRWDAMSPEERKAEAEAKRIARDREILAARSVLLADYKNSLQRESRKGLNAPSQTRVSAKPRERRTAGKSGAGTGSGGDSGDSDSSDDSSEPPRPGARAQTVQSLNPKKHKTKYYRRSFRRSWRVSGRRAA